MGRAHARLLAGERKEAASDVVASLRRSPTVGALRDGLDREGLDAIDGVLEWHDGNPSPVDAEAFAGELEAAVPGDPTWLLAVADSQLREALRADGRATKRVEARVERRGANGVETVTQSVNEPTAEGDEYMRRSIDLARRARALAESDTTTRALAQSLRVHAERMLLRGENVPATPLLAESGRLLGIETPSQIDETALARLRAALESELGDLRPRFRPGR
jgi:hypothetical protein